MSKDLREVDVQYARPLPGLTPGDIAEFGANMVQMGMAPLEVRGLQGDLQQIAAQAVMNGTNKVLERMARIKQEQFREIDYRIRMLNAPLGYVSKDVVLSIISMVANSNGGSQ
jgi:hypothetical protein